LVVLGNRKSAADFTDSRLILLCAVADINCRNEAGPTSIAKSHPSLKANHREKARWCESRIHPSFTPWNECVTAGSLQIIIMAYGL